MWSAQRSTLGGPMRCALKIIRSDRARDPSAREMFLREGRLALALSGHGNVVSMLDMGEHEGRLYLAMEEVDGVTLAELARRMDRPWPVAQAVHVAAAVLRALVHVHGYTVGGEAHGVVHRDVTPHNVMVSSRGEIKLMGFGIAQPSDSSPSVLEAMGTLSYAPREQLEGEPDERSDLFGVGAILFELLDGRRFRWHCADEDALFQEIYRDRVPELRRRRDVPPPVLALLQGLLQPRREHRIASAAAALQGLEAWPGFRWVQGELEALYRGVIGARHSGRTGIHQAVADDAAPLPRARSSSSSSTQAVPPSGPRSPWDGARPADEPASAPRQAANDSGRRARAQGRAPAADALDAMGGVPTEPHPQAPSSPRHRVTASAPTWAATPEPSASRVVTGEEPAVDEHQPTRVQREAESPVLDDVVTRRHRSTSNDVPSSRDAALDIAVTRAVPSKQAPWSPESDPIARRLVRPEPGAPRKRRRAHTGDVREESSGSVSPRARQSASMHRAASGAMRTHEVTGEVVAGEIVEEDDLPGDPVWRVGSR